MPDPHLIEGSLAVDERGSVSFINGFNFPNVKRFYTVKNHQVGQIRAWHAHKVEAKFACVVSGSALFGVVKIDSWEQPSKDAEMHRFVLSALKPTILHIPQGFAHGYKTLTLDTNVLFFSTTTLEESQNDDYRFDSRHWDIWNISER